MALLEWTAGVDSKHLQVTEVRATTTLLFICIDFFGGRQTNKHTFFSSWSIERRRREEERAFLLVCVLNVVQTTQGEQMGHISLQFPLLSSCQSREWKQVKRGTNGRGGGRVSFKSPLDYFPF